MAGVDDMLDAANELFTDQAQGLVEACDSVIRRTAAKRALLLTQEIGRVVIVPEDLTNNAAMSFQSLERAGVLQVQSAALKASLVTADVAALAMHALSTLIDLLPPGAGSLARAETLRSWESTLLKTTQELQANLRQGHPIFTVIPALGTLLACVCEDREAPSDEALGLDKIDLTPAEPREAGKIEEEPRIVPVLRFSGWDCAYAAFLSLVIPGAGLIYAGYRAAGIMTMILVVASHAIAMYMNSPPSRDSGPMLPTFIFTYTLHLCNVVLTVLLSKKRQTRECVPARGKCGIQEQTTTQWTGTKGLLSETASSGTLDVIVLPSESPDRVGG